MAKNLSLFSSRKTQGEQGVQHLPHMAQLADFMRYQLHAAIPAVAVHA